MYFVDSCMFWEKCLAPELKGFLGIGSWGNSIPLPIVQIYFQRTSDTSPNLTYCQGSFNVHYFLSRRKSLAHWTGILVAIWTFNWTRWALFFLLMFDKTFRTCSNRLFAVLCKMITSIAVQANWRWNEWVNLKVSHTVNKGIRRKVRPLKKIVILCVGNEFSTSLLITRKIFRIGTSLSKFLHHWYWYPQDRLIPI